MSGPISELFGASAGGFYEQKLILTSSTFTCPSDGLYLLTAIGGGAAGTNSGRGGCAGGFANRLWRLTRGAVANITIGAGGATNGASGGNTFIVFPDLYMQADGGSSTAGGGAFGGEINITGGASGNTAGSGGGAVGIYGVGYASTATGGGGGAGTGGRTLGLMAELLCLIGMAAPDMQEVAYCCLSGEAETRHIPMERQAVAVAAELASMAGMAVFSREAVVLARGLMVDQAA